MARESCPPNTEATCRQWVTMMGSPNLTTKAAYGQWNHLDTFANKDTYDLYQRWWHQMKADTPRAHPYERAKAGGFTSWTFPKPGTTAANDPLMDGLRGIHCKGVASGYGVNGRTKIRIGAYTFFGNRGDWISKKVRSLWNDGCDVSIEYSIMVDRIKKRLYSPSGRGRIPMRQVVTFNRRGAIDAYDHAKWIAMSGNWGGDPSSKIVWTGTTNISDLGFRIDDTGQVWRSASRVDAYMNDFSQLCRSKQRPRAVADEPAQRPGRQPPAHARSGSLRGLRAGVARCRVSTCWSSPRRDRVETRSRARTRRLRVVVGGRVHHGMQDNYDSRTGRELPTMDRAPMMCSSWEAQVRLHTVVKPQHQATPGHPTPAVRRANKPPTGTGRCSRRCRSSDPARCPACR